MKNTTFRKLDLFPSSGEGRHLLSCVLHCYLGKIRTMDKVRKPNISVRFHVFLCIHAVVQHLAVFVWVHYYNYLLLTSSFSYTLSYMQLDYYQRTSYQCVTSYAASSSIILRHPLNSGIELAVYLAFIDVFYSQYIQILLLLLCAHFHGNEVSNRISVT
jgi:hypothetical protein